MGFVLLASKLLDHIVKLAEKDENIQDIYLHVQTSNQVAKSFYERHNFEDKGIINDYYKRIDPPHCFLLVRNLRQES